MKYYVGNTPPFKPSIFRWNYRHPEDEDAAGKLVKLLPGISVPDFLKVAYGVGEVLTITGNFPFLTRDNQQKSYIPSVTDQFVSGGQKFAAEFQKEGLRLIDVLNSMSKAYEIPLAQDKDRAMLFPDVAAAKVSSKDNANRRPILSFIGSNADIAGKFTLTRAVPFGWPIVSYSGRDANDPKLLDRALDLIFETIAPLCKTAKASQILREIQSEQGDPPASGVGFPLFNAVRAEDGFPVSKFKSAKIYRGIYQELLKAKDRAAFEQVLAARHGKGELAGIPYAIAPIRRVMPGYKWAHQWQQTPSGLVLRQDVRGFPSVRVAWMPPYFLNVLNSVVQARLKVIRRLIPGLYHDGPSRKANLTALRSKKMLLHESDFSNYDRTIPNDLMRKILYKTIEIWDLPRNMRILVDMATVDVPVIFPDAIPPVHSKSTVGTGHLIRSPKLGLLSGLKWTSELGTMTTLVALVAGALKTKLMSEQEIKAYITGKSARGFNNPLWYIQSDDVLLSASNENELTRLVTAFRAGAEAAGFKNKDYPGDKFLMRHLTNGWDLPVASRVFQNTLSNEDPPSSALTFRVGVAVRTDGLCGYKSFDPFSTGRKLPVPKAFVYFEREMLRSVKRLMELAAVPDHDTTHFISLLIDLATCLLADWKFDDEHANALYDVVNWQYKENALNALTTKLDELRLKFLRDVAEAEVKAVEATPDQSYAIKLADALQNVHSPSNMLTAMLLEAELDTETLRKIESAMGKENAVYRTVAKIMGIPSSLLA